METAIPQKILANLVYKWSADQCRPLPTTLVFFTPSFNGGRNWSAVVGAHF